jgi:hypothetical protein
MIEKLKSMVGETYSTLAQNSRFTIISVEEKKVVIYIFNTKNNRNIPLKQIIRAWTWLTSQGSITQTQILRDIGCWSSAFVCGIFAHMPGVTHSTSPITLYYNK